MDLEGKGKRHVRAGQNLVDSRGFLKAQAMATGLAGHHQAQQTGLCGDREQLDGHAPLLFPRRCRLDHMVGGEAARRVNQFPGQIT